MFEDVPVGGASPGIYTQMTHDRQEDLDYMREMMINTALIMDPTVAKISKLWQHMLSYCADKRPMIVLRRWDWDDNRRGEGDEGVYKELREDPIGKAEKDIANWHRFLNDLEHEAAQRQLPFPNRENIRCHLINEPDTNNLSPQINIYTAHACELGTPLRVFCLTHNFGTGQPALQVAGPDTSPDWMIFLGSMMAAYNGGHTVGLHEYYNSLGLRHPSQFHWHIFRHKWLWKFLVEWNMEDMDVWMTEWGLEELVNHHMSDHHGWIGRIQDTQFAADYEWYSLNVACFIKRIVIFASDLPDRTWNSFNPRPAAPHISAAARKVWEKLDENDWPYMCADATTPPVDPPDPPTSSDSPMWPVDGVRTQRFGENPDRYEQFMAPGHGGIDIGADEGTPIVAAADGVVQWVDWDENYGWYIRIWHYSHSMHTFYAHMKERSFVPGGSNVKRGDPIGYVGDTGNSTGPHLHFETRMGDRASYFDVHEGYRKGRANPEAIYAAYGLEW